MDFKLHIRARYYMKFSVCKCINHSGTKGNEWGSLAIASNESRLNGYECALIYIRGAPGEIVELRFYDINLRKG